MTSLAQHAIAPQSRFAFRDFLLSVIMFWVSLNPTTVLLAFLLLQPAFDFTRSDELNLIRHILLRVVTVYLLLQTFVYLSRTKGRIRLFPTGLKRPLILYVGTAIISVGAAILADRTDIGRALLAVLTIFLLVSLMYIIPFWFRSRELVFKVIKVFFISVWVVGTIGVVQVGLNFVSPSQAFRLSSVFHDPNIYARFMVIAIFFAFSLLLFSNERIVKRSQLIGLIALAFFNLLFSFSRSGYATLVFGSLFFATFIESKKLRFLVIGSAILLGAGAFVVLVSQRFEGSAIVESSNLNRVQLILGGIEMIRNHWLEGIGYTNFGNFYKTFYLGGVLHVSPETYEQMGYATSIHNWFIEVWAEQGVVGLVGFMWLFVILFRKLRDARRSTADTSLQALLIGYSLMMFVFIFHGLFYITFISQFFFWVITGFALATARIALQDRARIT